MYQCECGFIFDKPEPTLSGKTGMCPKCGGDEYSSIDEDAIINYEMEKEIDKMIDELEDDELDITIHGDLPW